MAASPDAVARSRDATCGRSHSPDPSPDICRPGTVAGSIRKSLQNEALAAMIVSAPSSRSTGMADEATMASARPFGGSRGRLAGRAAIAWPSGPEAREAKAISRRLVDVVR